MSTTTTTTTTATTNPACAVNDPPYVPLRTTLPPNATCPCGTVFLPKGSKHDPKGLLLRIYYDSQYIDFDLVHNSDVYLSNEEIFITSTGIISQDINNINKIAILCDDEYNINILHQIRVILKFFDTKHIIALQNVGILNTKTEFTKTIIDGKSALILENNCITSLNTNLQNKKIQLEFYSVCDIYDEDCCDNITPNMILVNRIGYLSLPCCSTTTTSTTATPSTTSTTTTTSDPNRFWNRGLVGWDYQSGRCASFSNLMGVEDLQNPNYNLLVRNTSKWLVKQKINPKIIVLTTENAAANSLITSCLSNISNNVAILNKTFYNYDGSGLNDSDLLIMTAAYNWYKTGDISESVQNQMVDFVANGGAILTSEWLLWHTKSRSSLQILKTVFPVEPSSSWSGRTTLKFTRVTNNAIVSNGLPDSWVWTPGNSSGTETFFSSVKPNAIVFYDSSPAPALYPTIIDQPTSQFCAFNQNSCLVAFSVGIELRLNNANGNVITPPYPGIIYTWQTATLSNSGPWRDVKTTSKGALIDGFAADLPVNTWVRCVINTGTHTISTVPTRVNRSSIV
jgi:hypothetical protein